MNKHQSLRTASLLLLPPPPTSSCRVLHHDRFTKTEGFRLFLKVERRLLQRGGGGGGGEEEERRLLQRGAVMKTWDELFNGEEANMACAALGYRTDGSLKCVVSSPLVSLSPRLLVSSLPPRLTDAL
ncbi:unnamed protein product [Pleuronectes platessa]|uniref:Uncharacterized protein n=1 Tax=Pleuronectes platessa TaxID=8262 RepID=A0A9N7TNN9_PLEPL|nr:unnamed protein product [Pleuronectes platessa]